MSTSAQRVASDQIAELDRECSGASDHDLPGARRAGVGRARKLWTSVVILYVVRSGSAAEAELSVYLNCWSVERTKGILVDRLKPKLSCLFYDCVLKNSHVKGAFRPSLFDLVLSVCAQQPALHTRLDVC